MMVTDTRRYTVTNNSGTMGGGTNETLHELQSKLKDPMGKGFIMNRIKSTDSFEITSKNISSFNRNNNVIKNAAKNRQLTLLGDDRGLVTADKAGKYNYNDLLILCLDTYGWRDEEAAWDMIHNMSDEWGITLSGSYSRRSPVEEYINQQVQAREEAQAQEEVQVQEEVQAEEEDMGAAVRLKAEIESLEAFTIRGVNDKKPRDSREYLYQQAVAAFAFIKGIGNISGDTLTVNHAALVYTHAVIYKDVVKLASEMFGVKPSRLPKAIIENKAAVNRIAAMAARVLKEAGEDVTLQLQLVVNDGNISVGPVVSYAQIETVDETPADEEVEAFIDELLIEETAPVSKEQKRYTMKRPAKLPAAPVVKEPAAPVVVKEPVAPVKEPAAPAKREMPKTWAEKCEEQGELLVERAYDIVDGDDLNESEVKDWISSYKELKETSRQHQIPMSTALLRAKAAMFNLAEALKPNDPVSEPVSEPVREPVSEPEVDQDLKEPEVEEVEGKPEQTKQTESIVCRIDKADEDIKVGEAMSNVWAAFIVLLIAVFKAVTHPIVVVAKGTVSVVTTVVKVILTPVYSIGRFISRLFKVMANLDKVVVAIDAIE